MKFSYNILKSFVPELALPPQELADVLTMHSFETVIDREFTIDERITVVKIVKLEPHPNADRLRLATITDGKQEVRVVCGAPNIAEGNIVPYAPTGSRVYDEDGNFFTLTEATIRGVVSPGMLNSVRELGISDDHGGILLLPQDTVIGSALIEHIPSDTILDIDVLPDRANDASTHAGIAQEIAALTRFAAHQADGNEEMRAVYVQAAGIAIMGELMSKEDAQERREISFHPDAPSRVAGIPISHDEVKDILGRLRFEIKEEDIEWQVTVPLDRVDVLGEHDLVDEVVRLHGLDGIPASDTSSYSSPLPVSEKVYWENLIRKTFVQIGFTETYSYSFEDERFAKLINTQTHPHVELVNPISPEMKNLRYSMLPGLIGAMIKSRDEMHRSKKKSGLPVGRQERALFEIGRVYHRGDGGMVPGVIERPVVSGIAVGDEKTLQQALDTIWELFQIEGIVSTEVVKPFATVLRLSYADEFLGMIYVFNKSLLASMKYRMPVVAFEISFGALVKHAPEVAIPVKTLDEIRNTKLEFKQFVELPKYPSVFRDISLLVDVKVAVDQVQATIERIGKEIVVDVDLFDEFESTAESKKSLAFHIEYRSPDKTLTDSEILGVHNNIERALKEQFGAEVR